MGYNAGHMTRLCVPQDGIPTIRRSTHQGCGTYLVPTDGTLLQRHCKLLTTNIEKVKSAKWRLHRRRTTRGLPEELGVADVRADRLHSVYVQGRLPEAGVRCGRRQELERLPEARNAALCRREKRELKLYIQDFFY